MASVSRSGLEGSCKMLGGAEGVCTKEPGCPAVLEGRSLQVPEYHKYIFGDWYTYSPGGRSSQILEYQMLWGVGKPAVLVGSHSKEILVSYNWGLVILQSWRAGHSKNTRVSDNWGSVNLQPWRASYSRFWSIR